MKKIFAHIFICILGILLGVNTTVMAQLSANTVKYRITYDAATQTYTAWVIPDYNVPNANNNGSTEKGGTAQYTLVVPKDFVITQVTDIKGTWTKPTDSDFRKLGPGNAGQTWPSGLDASLNYYVLGKAPTETDYGTFTAGTPVALFSFKGNGCYGPIKPLPAADAFIAAADANYSLNVANSFYSRSGQTSGGNVNPLEQFVNISGLPADCTPLAANPDNITTPKGSAVTTPVLQNDTKGGQPVSSTAVTVAIATPPTNGTATANANGTVTYVPNPNFTGTDCYVYRICDNTNTTICDTAKVCVTVSALRVIYAYDDNGVTNKNTPLTGNVLINDDKATGTAPLTVSTTPVQPPANGTVTLSAAGAYTYTPNGNFTGTDSFKYRLCDSGSPAVCDTATVFITVRDPSTAVNHSPIALSDNAATKAGLPVSGNVLTNDTDPDAGQSLTASLVTNPTHGTVVLNPNGTYTYTPNAGFVGDDSFTYKACDNGSPQLCTTTSVDLNIYSSDFANLPPVANSDVFLRTPTGTATGNVLTNDKDPEGGTLTLNTTPVTGPSNGTVVINPDGTFTYTPNAGYTGPDQFVYEVCDNFTPKLCSQATVFILPNSITNECRDYALLLGEIEGNTSYTEVFKNGSGTPSCNLSNGGGEGMAADTTINLIYIGVADKNIIKVYNYFTGTFGTDIILPAGLSPAEVILSSDGAYLYAGVNTGIVKINTVTKNVEAIYPLANFVNSAQPWIWGLAINPITGNLYASTNWGETHSGASTIEYVSPSFAGNTSLLTTAPSGYYYRSIVFDKSGNLWALMSSQSGPDKLVKYNGTTGAIINSYDFPTPASGNGVNNGNVNAYDLTWGPDGNLYIATGNGDCITKFDILSGTFSTYLPYKPGAFAKSIMFICGKFTCPSSKVDLHLQKSISKKQAKTGDVIDYTVKVWNESSTPATGVVVSDSLNAGVQYVSSSATRGNYSFSTKQWTIGNIAANGDTITLTIRVKVLSQGVWFNMAEITKTNEEDVDSTPGNGAEGEDDMEHVCFTVPIDICTGEKVQASVPSQYSGVQWYRNGSSMPVASGNTVLFSETGTYTYTALNNTCPAQGCCPIIIEPGNNCCPVNLCIPVTVTKRRKK